MQGGDDIWIEQRNTQKRETGVKNTSSFRGAWFGVQVGGANEHNENEIEFAT